MRLWVLGHDVAWTAAPAMFKATMERLAIPGHCQLRDVEQRVLPAVIDELRHGVVDGCIVERPFRAVMAAACDELSTDAQVLGSVNVIVVDNGRLIGDNTLPIGIEMGLSQHRMWPPASSRTVILGAGEAACAAAVALSRVPAHDIAFAARRIEAAEAAVQRVGQIAPARAIEWSESTLKRVLGAAQMIINCTPVGPKEMPISIHRLASRCTVADMNLTPRPTETMQVAVSAHRRGCDGVDIYLYTQMIAFGRCTGIEGSWAAAQATLDAEIVSAPVGVHV